MKEAAFWGFFVFGALTVLLALGGGTFALLYREGATSKAIGFLLLFTGLSLGGMLAGLLYIQNRGKKVT